MLPRRAQRSVDLLTWVQPSNVGLLGGAPAASPFVPVDGGNPLRRTFPSDLRTFVAGSNLNLLTAAVASPFVPTQWGNPQGRRSAFAAMLSQTPSDLLGSTLRSRLLNVRRREL